MKLFPFLLIVNTGNHVAHSLTVLGNDENIVSLFFGMLQSEKGAFRTHSSIYDRAFSAKIMSSYSC